MGYRSDVVYVFYTRKPDKIPFAMLKLWFDENWPKSDYGEVDMGNDYIKVSYNNIKWYDGYPEVQAVQQAVEIFTAAFEANDNDNVAYEVAQVGEDLTDCGHDGSSYHDYRLGISREIHFS